MTLRRSRLLIVLALAVAVALAGCGGGTRASTRDATLVLDFTPNAVHAGIFLAVARDYDGAEGVDVRVRAPSASTDAVRLLESGRAKLAILDISDLALAHERGADIVGVMALVQRPLAAVFARPQIRSPRSLEGRRAGVTGVPSDVAVLASVVRGAGGDPDRVRRTTIGFNAVPALVSGRVDAATAFWNVEGLELRDRLPGVREFRVDRYGAPAYPELVLAAARTTVQDDPELVQGVVDALRRGYEEALQDPESAVESIMRGARGTDREQLLAGLRAVQPAFTAGVPRFGMLNRERLLAWARWAARFGIVQAAPDVDAAFVPRFANRD
jgi:ABC-type nitrate/sulfonate/bicarbonate transport system substrate-binding protein